MKKDTREIIQEVKVRFYKGEEDLIKVLDIKRRLMEEKTFSKTIKKLIIGDEQ